MARKRLSKNGEHLLIDEAIVIHKKKGNGTIRRQVWINLNNEITRYSLAYINHHLCHEDNGRVLGYDNAHGYHHKHYMGTVKPIIFTSFDEIEDLFQKEFEVLHEKFKKS